MKTIVTTRKNELLTYVNKLKCFFHANDTENLFTVFYMAERLMEEGLIDSEMSEKIKSERKREELREKIFFAVHEKRHLEEIEIEEKVDLSDRINRLENEINEMKKQKLSIG